ncbi:Putative transcriptional regulatory protein C3C7.04 [Fusarium oxysporum f. sp. cubense race 1]|uniref:Putative transcriptional regulatory protein C3C7.04 n=1 Tax=Fusarium oxysporum f. sp. cubense (strain race 1) TaxID=1229664 RepID=N4UZU3_FUSC1|nr:Putative transcriptional regulatory protein C3C7.04 [Fusarium oxysporum f. sp. cubense race 1]
MDETLIQDGPGPEQRPPPTKPRRGDGIGVGPRTSTACLMCRDKKVKCSGTRPCVYCVKRGLDCVFTRPSRRRLYSVTHIRNLEERVAQYENRDDISQAGSGQPASAHSLPSPAVVQRPPSLSGSQVEGNASRDGQDTQRQQQQQPSLAPRSPHHEGLQPAATLSPRPNPGPRDHANRSTSLYPALAPGTSLSSSDTFSSELRTLLTERSRPDPGPVSARPADATPRSICQSRLGVDKIKYWPTEDDAHSMLNIVVLNVGISQHLFDVRTFSDNLFSLFNDDAVDTGVTELWYAECLLVFAIGRLLQAKWDDMSKPPGDEFFHEALKRMPDLSSLRKQGVLGIELMGLSALYLQIADRKDDAYLYASTALRLSLGLSLHKSGSYRSHMRSEAVHRNRLWWSIYMQERRLAAAVGFPMSISDGEITAAQPADQIGYQSAAAIAVNAKLAQITGRITTTIYSQSNEEEAAFIKEVQDILQSLRKIENEMPAEISDGSNPAELILNEAPLSSSQLSSARTTASLHLTVNQNIIYAVRPILLYMARNSFSGGNDLYTSMSPALRRLADICVEAARKSLVILHGLCKQDIIAKHAFLDLDCLFSTGFIFVLAVIINSDKAQAYQGIESVRSILTHLSNLGNRAATKRLAEIDQMCASLTLETETPDVEAAQPQMLMQPFSFQASGAAPITSGEPQVQDLTSENAVGEQDAVMAGAQDLGDIVLEGEDDLYWIYHNPSLSLTGVEQLDWETLENHMV